MKHRNLMMVAIAAAGLAGLGGAFAQGAGCAPDGRMGMKSGRMQGGPMQDGMMQGGMMQGGMMQGGMMQGGMMQGGMMQGGMMEPGARSEQRLARLKEVIKPTGQQEPLWQAFAEKSRTEAEKGFKAMRERAGQDKPMTAPERMAQMQTSMKDRVAAMESVNESFKRLYAALSPEQKAAADKQFSGPGSPGPHGHGGPARGGPGGPGGGQEPRQG